MPACFSPATCTVTDDPAKSAPTGQVRCALAGPAPSMRNSAVIRVWSGQCMLRQPCFQTAESLSQRLRFPVSSTSIASAKLDLPLPLRPTTKVRPGRGITFKVAAAPIPRNPLTVSDCRYAPAGVGGAVTSGAFERGCAWPPNWADKLSSPSKAASKRSADCSGRGISPKRRRTIPSRTSSILMLYHGIRPAARLWNLSRIHSYTYNSGEQTRKCRHRRNSDKEGRIPKLPTGER